MQISLRSPQGIYSCEVNLKGGFIQRAQYKDNFELFYSAGWQTDGSDLSSLDSLTSHLGGEFTCVPFGAVKEDSGNFFKDCPHGYSCNADYETLSQSADKAVIRVNYPESTDISAAEKTVSCTDEGIKVDIKVFARRDCALPLGEHPCFRTEDGVKIEIKGRGITYPEDVEAGISRLIPHTLFDSLNRVANKDGGFTDCSSLPFACDTEEIAMMIEPEGEALLHYEKEKKSIRFSWDAEVLPSCLLWMSNRGRAYFPWNGRNLCLGIEPVASAWDKPELSLKGDGKLSSLNVRTLQSIRAEEPLSFSLKYEVLEKQQ